MKQTEYGRVTFRVRTHVCGATQVAMSAKNGAKLVRITEDGRDDLIVTTSRGTSEVPWSNVASAEPVGTRPLAKAKPK